mmetsp:Transcript_33534/g.70511  ORF Transcript_33534/g.70511 Transcript_33534/m.70511 type:complete len:333 (+) Transcript_33534:135-1133(+)|eukprot:CAMPEP_0183710998 /NCGR_PEP_ID=MMETSP0737-20130205/6600_1 /TAXON_ID=385413 /ORGANISM="Thalassiosira miniscula, Strain CCMP1093" /LENGTH=332 /DNA_ID=CAMNT_0025939389 /DNA_START=65 /DNA_END=1063 /DNA_ORIENTATION=+
MKVMLRSRSMAIACALILLFIARGSHSPPLESSNDDENSTLATQQHGHNDPPHRPIDRIQCGNANEIYAWQHIPKTAGSAEYVRYMRSLQSKGCNIYPITDTIHKPFDWNSPGCRVNNSPNGGTHCASSEISECLHSQIHKDNKDLQVKMLSSVRHPVARVVSEYFYFRIQATSLIWTDSMNNIKDNFTAWVLDEENIAHNRQAFYFLLEEGFPQDGEGCLPFSAHKHIQYIKERFGSVESFNKMKLPTNILDNYAFVGIADDPVGSDIAFMSVADSDPAFNVYTGDSHSSGKHEYDHSIHTLIEERNKLDMQLYREVTKWQQIASRKREDP